MRDRIVSWRLGVAAVSVALPFAFAASAMAQESPEVASAEVTCIDSGYDTGACSEAVEQALLEGSEGSVNSSLESLGVAVDLGDEEGTEADDVTVSSGNPAVPAVPVTTVPPIPSDEPVVDEVTPVEVFAPNAGAEVDAAVAGAELTAATIVANVTSIGDE
jgi:hypothetical protein